MLKELNVKGNQILILTLTSCSITTLFKTLFSVKQVRMIQARSRENNNQNRKKQNKYHTRKDFPIILYVSNFVVMLEQD